MARGMSKLGHTKAHRARAAEWPIFLQFHESRPGKRYRLIGGKVHGCQAPLQYLQLCVSLMSFWPICVLKSVTRDVALFLVGAQVTVILKFFISHNIRTARQQAWDQTVASRGKGVDFWQPYVEERDAPPVVKDDFATGMKDKFGLWFISVFVKKGGYCVQAV